MKTKAVRLWGKMDLRLEEFELPEMREDEILAEVVTDSLCMSSYKAITQAERHKKVPGDIHEHPIILGHEFCGKIVAVGDKWKNDYQPGDKFVIQPNIGHPKGYAPGYSFRYMGGDATNIIFSNEVMESGSLLKYNGDSYFEGSLVEPLSCVVGAFHAQYHMKKMYSYEHVMGIKEGGNMALLGATGPMGFLAIDLAIHGPKKPSLLIVTGRTPSKIDLAKRLYTEEEAARNGIRLIYINTGDMDHVSERLRSYTEENHGYDDVFVFAPNKQMVEDGTQMLAYDGCLNFFSGPSDTGFCANMNFYNVHYNSTHIVGTSGGNTDDMKESIQLIEQKTVNAAKIATHILGLDQAVQTTKELPQIGGGKKIVYTHHKMPLTEVSALTREAEDPLGYELARILERHRGCWNSEAEQYFLEHAPRI